MFKGLSGTATGKIIDPLDLKPCDVDIADIAHSLANQCRYNGHTRAFYSVAEHSVKIAQCLKRDGYDPQIQMLGLLHDCSEAYTGDIIRPLKYLDEMAAFREIEKKVEERVFSILGLPYPFPDVIHEYDNRIAIDETNQIVAWKQEEQFHAEKKPLGVILDCWYPKIAAEIFLMQYDNIALQINPNHKKLFPFALVTL